jgi:hypothetical protein
MVDILLAVLLGVLTLITAYLGVHVTLHPAESHREKWAYKIGFTVCGLTACVLIGIQTYRNNAAQQQLQSEITHIQNDTVRIEKNTEQAPRVEVNVPPPSVILQDRQHSSSKPPEPDERLHAMTNGELKAETLRLARQMVMFERNLIERAASYSNSLVFENGRRAPENQTAKRIYDDGITVYNNAMLKQARALRAELWRRVGPVIADGSIEAFEPLTDKADRIDVEHLPISDAAMYLEKLAKRLPK